MRGLGSGGCGADATGGDRPSRVDTATPGLVHILRVKSTEREAAILYLATEEGFASILDEIGFSGEDYLLRPFRVSDERREGYPHMTRGRSEAAKHTPPLITNTEAPEYTRLRRLVNLPFTVKRVEALRSRIQELVNEMLDEMLVGPKPVDLEQAFALPVPTIVITDMLGVSYDNRDDIQHASHTLVSHDATPEKAAEVGAVQGRVTSKRRCRPRWLSLPMM